MAKYNHIPSIFHFIYLFGKDTIDFNINHYFSIKSNILVNKPYRIYLWTNKPSRLVNNLYIKRLIIFGLEIKDVRKENFGDSDLMKIDIDSPYMAHKADLLRLKIMYKYGGIYSDVDSIAVHSMETYDPSLINGYRGVVPWYCYEKRNNRNVALCNGFFLAPAENDFIKACIKNYTEYDKNTSKPGTDGWGMYSVTKPFELAKSEKFSLRISESEAFQPFYCDRDSLEQLYLLDRMSRLDNPRIFQCHLWETRSKDFFKCITERYFYESNTTYAQLIRKLNLI